MLTVVLAVTTLFFAIKWQMAKGLFEAEVKNSNELLAKLNAGLTEEEVEWVVNSFGELGVRIRGQAFFLYKAHSLVYEPKRDDGGTPIMVRRVEKREFGESCVVRGFHPEGPEDKYTHGDGWVPLHQ